MTPQDLWDERVRIINEHRWADLADLYAEDCVIEMKFAPPTPFRITGRAALAEHLTSMTKAPLRFEVRDAVIHETADPETIIVEYRYHGTNTATGETNEINNIQLFRSRDGKLVETHDYHDHRAIGVLLGR
ncbi:nuclear transport factor 2 family protein [Hamadaea sp. NPDC051192]|uniref:nuclear transport factor 2 family protein n=1 Tax=Hamadaea sp. NPDC051192 TaxID=3154940 RepID=UPI003437E34E